MVATDLKLADTVSRKISRPKPVTTEPFFRTRTSGRYIPTVKPKEKTIPKLNLPEASVNWEKYHLNGTWYCITNVGTFVDSGPHSGKRVARIDQSKYDERWFILDDGTRILATKKPEQESKAVIQEYRPINKQQFYRKGKQIYIKDPYPYAGYEVMRHWINMSGETIAEIKGVTGTRVIGDITNAN